MKHEVGVWCAKYIVLDVVLMLVSLMPTSKKFFGGSALVVDD